MSLERGLRNTYSEPAHGNPGRRYDLDALRVLATLALIIFHTARAFDSDPWHVKNSDLVLWADILVTFMNVWFMPLFFFIAGAGCFFALRRRNSRQFIAERFERLLIPFLFGVLVVIPPQVYIERIGTSPLRQSLLNFDGSFLEFYPHFFTHGVYPDGNLTWNHLWFIIYLFTFSLILLPLFRYLKGAGQARLERFVAFAARGRALLLLALPIIVFQVALSGAFPGPQNFVQDLANIVRSLLLMVYGYMFASDERLPTALQRNRHLVVGSSLASGAILAALLLTYDWPAPYTGLYVVVQSLWAFALWSWVLMLVWLAHRVLNRETRWLRYANEIAYPFYILHQTVIVIFAHFVVRWATSVLVKFAVIAFVSLVSTWLLCELARSNRWLRYLLGMKPPTAPQPPVSTQTGPKPKPSVGSPGTAG